MRITSYISSNQMHTLMNYVYKITYTLHSVEPTYYSMMNNSNMVVARHTIKKLINSTT